MNDFSDLISLSYRDIVGYGVIFALGCGAVLSFISNISMKSVAIFIEDDYVSSEGLFGKKKIFYKDILSVNFSRFQGGSKYASTSFSIYITIFSINKSSISFFINSLAYGEMQKLFTAIVNNSEIYKNNEDFKKIASGDFNNEDTYRLAGVLDQYKTMYETDISKVENGVVINILKYVTIVGGVLLLVFFLSIAVYIIFSY